MAITNGSAGAVAFTAGADDDIFEWSVDYAVPVQNVTSFDDGTAARFISQGITEWSGSYSRYIDSAASPWSEAPGTTGSATLTALSAATYAGTIIVTGVSTSVAKTGGAIVQNVTFQGDSTLTIASPS